MQKKQAEEMINRAEQSGYFNRPIVTTLVEASTFHVAEDYHQDYLQTYPNGYNCHFERSSINL